jgi:hypothetical protein
MRTEHPGNPRNGKNLRRYTAGVTLVFVSKTLRRKLTLS